MKNIVQFFTLMILIFINNNLLNSQWVQSNFPYSGTVNCLTAGTNGSGGTNLFAGTEGGGVFLTTNDGTSWQAVNNGLGNYIVNSIALSGSNIFAGIGGIYRSTNNGASWELATVFPNEETARCVTVRDSEVFAGTYQWNGGPGGIYRSTNNGTSWDIVFIASRTYIFVSSLIISDTNVFAGTNTGVYLSTNNGLSWTPVNNGLPDYVNNYGWITTLAVSPNGAGGNNLFAGTDTAGVYFSTNNGTSWASIGMTDIYINAIAVTKTNLFAGTGSGMWRRSLSEITSVREVVDGKLQGSFALKQNYPNPFNPSTTIKYSIPTSEFLTLKIYDVLGNEVATLVNEEKPAGSYEVSFNAAKLSSGIYFYSLQSGSYTQTKKLILTK